MASLPRTRKHPLKDAIKDLAAMLCSHCTSSSTSQTYGSDQEGQRSPAGLQSCRLEEMFRRYISSSGRHSGDRQGHDLSRRTRSAMLPHDQRLDSRLLRECQPPFNSIRLLSGMRGTKIVTWTTILQQASIERLHRICGEIARGL
jgi:hypothetical protein